MIPEVGMVARLGFEAWADNLIVNALENLAAYALATFLDPEFPGILDIINRF